MCLVSVQALFQCKNEAKEIILLSLRQAKFEANEHSKRHEIISPKESSSMQSFFKTIIDKCDGCERIIIEDQDRFCKTYANPAAKWRNGICNFATHAKPEIIVQTVRINPLKASKRASGK